MINHCDILILGGGASGFFAANTIAKEAPEAKVVILEKNSQPLSKVRISGGGRCNVTHACFDPAELITFYPRGGIELLGPFHKFGPGDVIDWFEQRGVALKVEEDGRMFPVSDTSLDIVQTLLNTALDAGVQLFLKEGMTTLNWRNGQIEVGTSSGAKFQASQLLVSTGASELVWKELAKLGLKIIPQVPSLFTFRCADPRLEGLPGISVPEASISYKSEESEGPLLITHRGLSGPAVLKLSAWCAREMNHDKYKFPICIRWISSSDAANCEDKLVAHGHQFAKSAIRKNNPFNLPARLWERMVIASQITDDQKWAELRKEQRLSLLEELTSMKLSILGKDTFKDEFVTCGGVSLKEMNMRSFEAKRYKGLYLAGEILDIDAVTGGFNFQAAWTGGYLAGIEMARKFNSGKL